MLKSDRSCSSCYCVLICGCGRPAAAASQIDPRKHTLTATPLIFPHDSEGKRAISSSLTHTHTSVIPDLPLVCFLLMRDLPLSFKDESI